MARKPAKPPNQKRRRALRARIRDFKAEYARRVAHPAKLHLPLSVRRGHPRAGERPKPPGLQLIDPKRPEERAVRSIARGSTLRAAAKAEGITEERVRRYLKENTDARRVGRNWEVSDQRPRQYPFYSDKRLVSPWLSPEEASRAAKYMQAVHAFLPGGQEQLLAPFAGDGVVDIYAKRHPFEVEPNELYMLDQAGELDFPEIYKIVSET